MTAPASPLTEALDRLHTQVLVKLRAARLKDTELYWEGRVDALDWVLQRIDDLKGANQ